MRWIETLLLCLLHGTPHAAFAFVSPSATSIRKRCENSPLLTPPMPRTIVRVSDEDVEDDNDKVQNHLTPQCEYFVGFDLGTSGARISVLSSPSSPGDGEDKLKEVYTQAVSWGCGDMNSKSSYDDPAAWMKAVEKLLSGAAESLQVSFRPENKPDESSSTTKQPSVKAICVSGTSASCLLVDGKNAVDRVESHACTITTFERQDVAAIRFMLLEPRIS